MTKKIGLEKNISLRNQIKLIVLLGILIGLFFIPIFGVNAADPTGPDTVTVTSNSTRTTLAPKEVNLSGGYIGSINITATISDVRWKAFVGYVSGRFSLSDGAGATIYDWTLSSITGRIYTTRNSTSVTWATINCSNFTHLNSENTNMNHSNPNDNISLTFNTSAEGYTSTHDPFYVGSRLIYGNSCPSINTFVDNVTQDTSFEEIALYDGYNMVYATIIEPRINGYNSIPFDFQVIVPENGAPSFTGATAYYLYVEIGT